MYVHGMELMHTQVWNLIQTQDCTVTRFSLLWTHRELQFGDKLAHVAPPIRPCGAL